MPAEQVTLKASGSQAALPGPLSPQNLPTLTDLFWTHCPFMGNRWLCCPGKGAQRWASGAVVQTLLAVHVGDMKSRLRLHLGQPCSCGDLRGQQVQFLHCSLACTEPQNY